MNVASSVVESSLYNMHINQASTPQNPNPQHADAHPGGGRGVPARERLLPGRTTGQGGGALSQGRRALSQVRICFDVCVLDRDGLVVHIWPAIHAYIYLHLYPKQSSVKNPATCTPGRTSGRCCGSWASWRSPWRRTRGWVCVYMHVCMPVVNRPQYLTRHRHRRLYHHEDRRWPSCPRPATTTTWPSPTKCVDKCTQMCNLIGPHAPTNQTPTNIYTTNNSPWATPPRPSRATGPAWPPTRAASPTRTSTWAWRCRRQVGCETKQVCLWTRQQRAPTDAFTFHILHTPPPKTKNMNTHTMT